MTRTKHARKPKVERHSIEECDLLIKNFKRLANLRILKFEGECKMAIKSLETMVDVTLSRLPPEIRQTTLGEILCTELEDEKENCSEASSLVEDLALPKAPSRAEQKRITAVSDDGYATESVGSTRPSRATKKNNTLESKTPRRTRSSSKNNKMQLSEINQSTIKKPTRKVVESMRASKFKTPALLHFNNEYSVVTPKVKPNTPLNILRRPKQGEMVLSMQGSPLLVSAVVQEKTANINVPLRNGNIISLLPNKGLRVSHIPSLDMETRRQLETLKSHIEKVIASK